MTFGERIRKLREEKNLRQEDLASLINVHRATIGKYETDERSPDKDTIILLSEVFDVSTDFLLGKKVNDSNHISESMSDFEVDSTPYKNFNRSSTLKNKKELPIAAKIALKEFEEFLKKKYNLDD